MCVMPGCHRPSRDDTRGYCGACGTWKGKHPGFTRREWTAARDQKRCDCCFQQVPRTVVKWNTDGLCDHSQIENMSTDVVACIYCDQINLCPTCNGFINRFNCTGKLPIKNVEQREMFLDFLLIDDPICDDAQG